MKSFLPRLIFITLLLLYALFVSSHEDDKFYRKWMNLSSEELLKKGNKYIYDVYSHDSALVCYSMLANRYDEGMTKSEKKMCYDACIGKIKIYFLFYFDYPKMYESLIKASQISEDLDLQDPQVDLNFAYLYKTLFDQTHDEGLNKKSHDHFKKAFNLSVNQGDKHVSGIIFSNMMLTGYTHDNIKKVDVDWELYKEKIYDENDYIHLYNKHIYNIISEVEYKDYDKAIIYSDSLISSAGKSFKLVRFRCMALCIKARVYAMKGDYVNAVKTLAISENLSQQYKISDGKLDIYDEMARYYDNMNDKVMASAYRDKYYKLKDTLLNYRQLKSVSEMPFVNEIKNMEIEMDEIRHNNLIKDIVLSLVGVLFVFVIVFSIFVYRKNKELAGVNRSLYLNYQNMIKLEEEGRIKIDKYKKLLEHYENEFTEVKEKYSNSLLQDEEKNLLLEKILKVMENVEEISSPTFSSDRLAELIGEQYKYISQVINGEFGCNFNTLLNQYRVKEVCRRLSDDNKYGRYTTEAIGESLGFKSRTTFISSFKKVTGLTPLQYRKIAMNEK